MNDTEKLEYSIPGAKVMLLGESGQGKTDAIISLLEAGIKPFILFTEPGMTIIQKACTRRKVPFEDVHWKYLPPSIEGWGGLIHMAKSINNLSFEQLSKAADPNKRKHTKFIEILNSCNNFVCDKTGENFGDVAGWNTDRALVIDSFSGLSEIVTGLASGFKPTKSPAEWQIIQNTLKGFIKKLTTGTTCHVVIIGHLAREKNEVTGAIQIMIQAPGNKLAPELPKDFDDIVLAEVRGGDFCWSTMRDNAVVKHRNLSFGDKLPSSFVPLIEGWKKNGGKILPTMTSSVGGEPK